MKKLLTFCLIVAASFTVNAQTPPLNKQQTLDYLNKEFAKINDNYFKNFALDSKILVCEFNDGRRFRMDLSNSILDVGRSFDADIQRFVYTIYDKNNKENIICINGFSLESDAIRLKKALEHLITLVKAEKSTDPFDN